MSETENRIIGPSGHREIGSSGDRVIATLGERGCVHLRTAVIATWRSGHIIKRRRQCLDCPERFSTEENLPGQALIAANGDNLHCRIKTS